MSKLPNLASLSDDYHVAIVQPLENDGLMKGMVAFSTLFKDEKGWNRLILIVVIIAQYYLISKDYEKSGRSGNESSQLLRKLGQTIDRYFMGEEMDARWVSRFDFS